MNNSNSRTLPNIALSHFEIFVENVTLMENFYTQCLGLVVTDRGEGQDGMVFLSNSPQEHHQLVLTPRKPSSEINSPMDHIAFRVSSLTHLRSFYEALASYSANFQTVSHGNTWSIYFLDPENNRFELFTDTPWHVSQPCRFEVDFGLSDEELFQFTEQKIRNKPGFIEVKKWRESHGQSVSQLSEH
ncbi:VOC family protein [Marinomonas posidonica]|uniref:Glyoxalase/bleomycin resistance protein/dioxygenase n=1 Tax=Marinomonas posidonica (strain CECT 7376 / NCIMB 14433 / IVIA-Po-181) TaxID=491952 RepID=F6CUX8_MARPP|nr:VOC family protein [Marinomonas posidonica]AEF55304.1 Glyoxalase/bleomycin resistance protein/dioxygenase [Marinomonas posidonica IVIA-Po-181]